MGPAENPEDKAARERERAMVEQERMAATQGTAADLTTDLQAVYGRRPFSLFGMMK